MVIDRDRVDALAQQLIEPTDKGWPPTLWGRPVAEVRDAGLTLRTFPTPLVTLSRSALGANLSTMSEWAAEHGLSIAPHGKTTMAPQLWREQLDAGAWGITVATFAQLAVARSFGVARVVVANALLSPPGLRWLAADLAAHPDVRVLTWADSPAVVEIMATALAHADVDARDHPVDVLVELGGTGGRTGARTVADGLEIARAVTAAPGLRLAGVTGYEGALADTTRADNFERLRRYLAELARLHELVSDAGMYAGLRDGTAPLVSAGGSAYPDLVAEVLAPLGRDGATVLLRSGAYVTHDDGYYRDVSPLGRRPRSDGGRLRPALHGWACVSSAPEPGLIIVDAGKRDLPYDMGLPEVQLRAARPAGAPATRVEGAEVTAFNDQHAFIRFDPRNTTAMHLRVGDVLRLGLSHPCTTFDKWRLIPVVDDADRADPVVIDAVRTFF